MASFREVLSEGKIGDLRIGMPSEMVEKHLGPPDDRSVRRRPAEIFKYGSLELAFKQVPETEDSRLVAIAIYFFDPKRTLPSSVLFEDWTPTADTTEAEFREFLQSAGIQIYSAVDGENGYLVFESGASAAFVEGHLHSIHFRRTDKSSTRRQMSVSLPDATLAKLRDQAKREHISLQNLIEKVLAEAP